MVNVRLAKIQDIPQTIELLHEIQASKAIGVNQEIDPDSFAEFMMEAIMSGGVFTFVAHDEEKITGLLVLNEVSCPWNYKYSHGVDLFFGAMKGGNKLIRVAKSLGQKKGWQGIYFTTSMSNPRADKYFERIATKIGGTYKMELN